MSNKARSTSGKFAAKSETPRKIRSVNLTDDAWQWLADVATQSGVSRNDYLEAMAEGSIPLMETVSSKTSPFMETVESDNAKIAEQPDNNVAPFMETVKSELESLKQQLKEVEADRDKVFENSLTLKTKLERQVGELRLKFEKEEGDRQEAERELETERTARQKAEEELKQLKENPPEIDFDFAGKAADLKNWLGKILGKGLPKQVTVKEIRKILQGAIIEES